MNENIKNKLKALPDKPGVYIMRDNLNNIIYVGKAKILKNRVRSYFRKIGVGNNKVKKMVENINDFNWIVTDSEIEALILECNLIKRHRPKYNILLKDDKNFPYIKITVSEDFPRILITRKIDDKKERYFGPYVSSFSVKNTIDLLRKTYGIRDCSRDLSKPHKNQRECLNYHIKQCSSPCMVYISKEDYRARINEIIDFLEGRTTKIVNRLTKEMEEASENLQFEKAAELRDRINHVKNILEKQKISAPKNAHYDVIGVFKGEKNTCVTILFVRGGKLLGTKNMYFGVNESEDEVLTGFLKQFYDNEDNIPKEILIPFEIPEKDLLSKLLTSIKGSSVLINVPIKGRKKEMIDLANKNAQEGIKQKTTDKYANVLEDLKNILNLNNIPERIEVYDISNTAGVDIVGFMTVFENGHPKKSDYRKFKIKYTEGQDDYECMYEVILRRLSRYLNEAEAIKDGSLEPEKAKFINLPDLIFVDGGKNHVKFAKKAVRAAELDIEVFGLVKDNKHKTKDITSDVREYGCYKNRPVFNLISKMQDETHNQAVGYHHSLRTKSTLKSELLKIKGVGEKTRNNLFDRFKTIENIKKASVDELSKAVSKKVAQNIYDYFN